MDSLGRAGDAGVRPSDDGSLAVVLGGLYPELVAAVSGYVGSATVAEDIAQDAIARAWEHRDRLDVVTDWRLWVFRVAINRARSWRRRVLVELRHLPVLAVHADTASRSDDALTVRAALKAVPPRQRAAVVLRYYGELSVDETAQVMECAPGTVRALTSQGLASLRDRLEGSM